MPSPSPCYDLAVVGAGPAGAAAAIRAKQLAPDARVLLLDRAEFPRDKPCGDGISSHSVAELATLDALDALDGYPPMPMLHLRGPEGTEVVAAPPQSCFVVPRAVFDGRLVDAAKARGVEVRCHRVRRLERRAGSVVVDDDIEARVVVGSDGANSVVRRLIGIAPSAPEHTAVAIRGYAARTPASPDELLITLEEPGSLAYAWAFPLPDGGANVGYGRLVADTRADEAAGLVDLERRMRRLLPGLGAVDGLRVHRLPLATGSVRQPAGRVLLAGDALSLVNPITGEGIHHALHSGRLAGEIAVTAVGDPGLVHRRVLQATFGAHLRQTAQMARLCRRPGFVDAAFELSQRRLDVWHSICDIGLGSGTIPARLIARQLVAYSARRARRLLRT